LVLKYENNEKVLKKLSLKITKLKATLNESSKALNQKQLNTILILNHLDYKTQFALYNIYSKKEKVVIETKEKFEQRKSDTYDISSEDKEKVDSKLVEIQLNLLENFTNKLNKITDEFNSLVNYEEK